MEDNKSGSANKKRNPYIWIFISLIIYILIFAVILKVPLDGHAVFAPIFGILVLMVYLIVKSEEERKQKVSQEVVQRTKHAEMTPETARGKLKASFIISEIFITSKNFPDVLKTLEERFRTVSQQVEYSNKNALLVRSIAKTFLISEQRKDTSVVMLNKTDNKYVCTVYVKYKLPLFDKIILIIIFLGLFVFQWLSLIGIIAAIYILICFFSQKKTVYNTIKSVLKSVKDEVEV